MIKSIQLLKTVVPKNTKFALVRVDLNVESIDEKFSLRIDRCIPTIMRLRRKGYRVILMSHRGHPVGVTREAKFSLKPFSKIISKKCKEPVVFIPHMSISQVFSYIQARRAGVFLLENVRFFQGEDKNSRVFAKQLSTLGDVYVNEAFASCDRKRASTCAITSFLPSYAGSAFMDEIRYLSLFRHAMKKSFVLVLGGAKISDKLPFIQAFYTHARHILLGGGIANTWMHARGIPVGASLHDASVVYSALRPYEKKVVYPQDVVFQHKKIVDIGPHTSALYASYIRSARCVLWGGPLGNTDDRRYWNGSRHILDALCASTAISVIGGGETTSFVLKQKKKIPQRIFLSTGGGAMLAYVSGKKLPGLVALEKSTVALRVG